MENYFSGKVALVTGAGAGIGRETALLYAAHGAKVVISDIDESGGAATVDSIKGNGADALFVKADVSRPKECEALVKRSVEAFGSLDIACNNAGLMGEHNSIADMSIEGWRKVIDTNLSGLFFCMKYEIDVMLRQGRGGSIVNMASVLGMVGFDAFGPYVAAKHGVIGLTQTAAIEYSNQDIRINAVAPGFIETSFLGNRVIAKSLLERMHPAGRMGQPREVAELVIWLSSDKASFASGGVYPVDGGYLAR